MHLTDVTNATNKGPMCSSPLSAPEMIRKLHGMNTDHANDQKKAAKLLYEWKVESWLQSLAHGKMSEFSQNEVDLFTQSVQMSRLALVVAKTGQDVCEQQDL